jgi:site-specific DNA recombinase
VTSSVHTLCTTCAPSEVIRRNKIAKPFVENGLAKQARNQGGEGGIRSGRVSQALNGHQFAPKVLQHLRLASLRSVLVVCGSLAIFGIIFSTNVAQLGSLTGTSSTVVTTALRSVPWPVLSAATPLLPNRVSELGWLPSTPVFTRCTISRPARIREKNWAGDPSFGGRALMILCGVMAAAAIVPGSSASGKRSAGGANNADRKRLQEETAAAADRIAAEAHAAMPRSKAESVGAIYVRFSTLFQDSAVDQIRELYDFAVANKIFVPRDYVFFDLGVRGHKNQREGLDQLRSILAAKKVQVLLLFATNRLFRKVYLTLQFVDQTAVENGIRCVFLKSGIDTANKDQWQSLLHMRAMVDEFQVRVNADHIRAALKGMFLEGLVRGTLHLGYTGTPLAGKLTKRGRPRRRLVINDDEAKIVRLIFEWYVNDRLSLNEIAQKLNGMPEVPKPRNSARWRHDSVRAVLLRETYRGLWNFSVTERKFLSSKDYTRQIPRDAPLNQTTFENLRIVSDALWFAAQQRLAKNKRVRGRKSKSPGADPSPRILSGLFWCPEHDRPLRACSVFGNYLGCPSCATMEAGARVLFSKAHRHVVLQLLCKRLTELIRLDSELVAKIVLECQSHGAAIQRPDKGEIARLEKLTGDLKRKIDFNLLHPGETDEDLKESADVVRSLRAERTEAHNQLALMRAVADEPVRVPSEEEVRDMLRHFDDVLRRAAAGQIGDDQGSARDILETLTGGRIDMYQQGERRDMRGWLQGRFTVRLLDVLVEKIAGAGPAKGDEGVEVAIDFKRPRKTDVDADEAIRLWLDGNMNKEIAEQFGSKDSYISRLLRIGAERMGTTVEALKSQRKRRPVDPSRAPRYQLIADEVKSLWWDALYPLAEVARKLRCSTTTVTTAIRHWHESRRVPVPEFNDWSRRLEERVVALFDENILEIHEIGDAVHLGRTRVMVIVRDVYRRLGKESPDGRTRRSRLKGEQTSIRPVST